jgi:hypothetical protein
MLPPTGPEYIFGGAFALLLFVVGFFVAKSESGSKEALLIRALLHSDLSNEKKVEAVVRIALKQQPVSFQDYVKAAEAAKPAEKPAEEPKVEEDPKPDPPEEPQHVEKGFCECGQPRLTNGRLCVQCCRVRPDPTLPLLYILSAVGALVVGLGCSSVVSGFAFNMLCKMLGPFAPKGTDSTADSDAFGVGLSLLTVVATMLYFRELPRIAKKLLKRVNKIHAGATAKTTSQVYLELVLRQVKDEENRRKKLSWNDSMLDANGVKPEVQLFIYGCVLMLSLSMRPYHILPLLLVGDKIMGCPALTWIFQQALGANSLLDINENLLFVATVPPSVETVVATPISPDSKPATETPITWPLPVCDCHDGRLGKCIRDPSAVYVQA